MSDIYTPDMGLKAKLERHMARHFGRRNILPQPERPIISFSFDDCPKTALDNGAALLETEGWHGTFYMAMGLCGTTNHLGLHMSQRDVKAAFDTGHEIADHTYDHIDAQKTPLALFMINIEKNQTALDALGIPASRNFAYPYGSVSLKIKKRLKQEFELVRGVCDPETAKIDTALIPAMRMYSGHHIEDIIQTIKSMSTPDPKTPRWLNIYTHDISDNPSPYGCTPHEMRRIVNVIKDMDMQVMPMNKAYDRLAEKFV